MVMIMTRGEEQLARAAYDARFGPVANRRGVVPLWEDLGDGVKAIWLRVAVAVLEHATDDAVVVPMARYR